jgi:hypothetical protein
MEADHPLLLGVEEVRKQATGRLSDGTLDDMAREEERLCERITDMVTVLSNPRSRYYPKNDDDHVVKIRKLGEMEERQQAVRECLMIHGRQNARWVCKCGVSTLLYSGQCTNCTNSKLRGEE